MCKCVNVKTQICMFTDGNHNDVLIILNMIDSHKTLYKYA